MKYFLLSFVFLFPLTLSFAESDDERQACFSVLGQEVKLAGESEVWEKAFSLGYEEGYEVRKYHETSFANRDPLISAHMGAVYPFVSDHYSGGIPGTEENPQFYYGESYSFNPKVKMTKWVENKQEWPTLVDAYGSKKILFHTLIDPQTQEESLSACEFRSYEGVAPYSLKDMNIDTVGFASSLPLNAQVRDIMDADGNQFRVLTFNITYYHAQNGDPFYIVKHIKVFPRTNSSFYDGYELALFFPEAVKMAEAYSEEILSNTEFRDVEGGDGTLQVSTDGRGIILENGRLLTGQVFKPVRLSILSLAYQQNQGFVRYVELPAMRTSEAAEGVMQYASGISDEKTHVSTTPFFASVRHNSWIGEDLFVKCLGTDVYQEYQSKLTELDQQYNVTQDAIAQADQEYLDARWVMESEYRDRMERFCFPNGEKLPENHETLAQQAQELEELRLKHLQTERALRAKVESGEITPQEFNNQITGVLNVTLEKQNKILDPEYEAPSATPQPKEVVDDQPQTPKIQDNTRFYIALGAVGIIVFIVVLASIFRRGDHHD